MSPRYLIHNEIDKQKWDRCIAASPNGLPYALSACLDRMSAGWDALVLGDYEAVMPLTKRQKYGISYLYQPAFCQQLGVFGPAALDKTLVDIFLSSIPKHFRFIEIHLNFMNETGHAWPRLNLVLDLGRPYEDILAGYTAENIKNLRKADKRGARATRNLALEQVFSFYTEAYGNMSGIGIKEYENYRLFLQEMLAKGKAELWGVEDGDGTLCCAACFLLEGNRAVYVLGAPDKKGRELQATHTLIDAFIRHHAGKNVLLDFEGSEIPAVAHFYRKFGPAEQPFYVYRKNRLPFFLRIFKR